MSVCTPVDSEVSGGHNDKQENTVNSSDDQSTDSRSILFVCYGNICRSPMAKFLFERLARENGIEGARVSSAGLHALPGNQSPEEALEAMSEIGIDMSGHRAQTVAPSIDSEYDLILLMDRSNLREFNSLFPESCPKTKLLGSFAKKNAKKDVQDPYGGSLDDYRDSRDAIMMAVKGLVEKLAAGKLD